MNMFRQLGIIYVVRIEWNLKIIDVYIQNVVIW